MKKKSMIILLLLHTFIVYGQDTTYLDDNLEKVSSINNATYYKVIQYEKADTNRATENVYFISGQIKTHKNYSNYKNKKNEGKLKEWYENGQLSKEIDYKNDKKNGKLKEWYENDQLSKEIDYKDDYINGKLLTFWKNGKPKRIDEYKNGEFIKGICSDSNGVEIIHYDYEKMPEFPGGIDELFKYITKETIYPKKSRKKDIEGTVIINFIVNKDGSLSDFKIFKSVYKELDEEALRVIKNMPNWYPGMQDGEAVKVSINIPIRFKLY